MARMDVMSGMTLEFSAQGEQSDAFFDLGLSYCTGRDGPVDLIQAHKWFSIAAVRGSDDAKRYRSELANDMTRADITRAQRLAREWLASVH
jgi:uncharacterized protein